MSCHVTFDESSFPFVGISDPLSSSFYFLSDLDCIPLSVDIRSFRGPLLDLVMLPLSISYHKWLPVASGPLMLLLTLVLLHLSVPHHGLLPTTLKHRRARVLLLSASHRRSLLVPPVHPPSTYMLQRLLMSTLQLLAVRPAPLAVRS
jgi:hypothetical protein